MKRILSSLLVCLLLAALCVTALAEGEQQGDDGPTVTATTDEDGNPITVVDYGDGNVISIQELPEYGEGEEIIFLPPEDSPAPTENPTGEEESDRAASEGAQAAPSPGVTPELDTGSREKNNTPVMIGIAVLAVCVIAAVIVAKKRRSGGK